MRIALVTNLYPPIQTGTAHWTQELARHLSRCGYTVTVIACGAASGPMAPPEIDGAAAVYRLPARRLRASRLLLGFDEFYISNTKANRRRIIDILRERRIQIVHQCGHLLDLTYATPLIARELGIPCVCSIHTVIHFPASRLVDALMKTLDRTIVRHFGPGRYDSLIALDAETRGYIEQTYHHPRTRTVLVSIDDDVLQRMPVESDPPPPFRILSIGHVTRMRSRLDLIAAVERLRNRGTRVEMVIVGKLCDPRPVDYVRARGLENIIRFTGELPRAEVFELARTCHMEAHWITVPGLGTATLEAMALGLPVMAWAFPGLYGDVPLEDGKTLLFATPGDIEQIAGQIERLIQSAPLRRAIGTAGRQLVRNYLSWDTAVLALAAVYGEAVGKPLSVTAAGIAT